MPGCSRVIDTSSLRRWLKFSIAIFLLLLTANVLVSAQVFAQTNRKIDATVQVSVCGNGIAEGGEQCDNADLMGKSCTGLQYESGTLACTKSCDFDLSKCKPFVNFAGEVLVPAIARQPTPTTKPIVLPILTSTGSAELTIPVETSGRPEQHNQPEQKQVQVDPQLDGSALLDVEQDAQVIMPSGQIDLRLKSIYELLDIEAVTESNQIDQSYLPTLVRNWSQSWRKTTTLARFTTPAEVELQVSHCDTNSDGVCTVEDLSILLYYVSADPMEQQP